MVWTNIKSHWHCTYVVFSTSISSGGTHKYLIASHGTYNELQLSYQCQHQHSDPEIHLRHDTTLSTLQYILHTSVLVALSGWDILQVRCWSCINGDNMKHYIWYVPYKHWITWYVLCGWLCNTSHWEKRFAYRGEENHFWGGSIADLWDDHIMWHSACVVDVIPDTNYCPSGTHIDRRTPQIDTYLSEGTYVEDNHKIIGTFRCHIRPQKTKTLSSGTQWTVIWDQYDCHPGLNDV